MNFIWVIRMDRPFADKKVGRVLFDADFGEEMSK